MTQIATPLFISRNDIIKNSPLQGAIDADALLPFVYTAQVKYIKDLLGTVLYDYIGAQILAGTTASLSAYYQDLINEHIKHTLIWYSCVEYIPFSSISFKSNGAVKHLSDQSIAPSKTDIDFLTGKCQSNADYFATRMQNYLIAYSVQIPQYLQSVGNATMIFPNMANAYFGGIQLD
jgi:hypothetical protein